MNRFTFQTKGAVVIQQLKNLTLSIAMLIATVHTPTVFSTQVIPNPVNPQIGENLWQMNYRQSIAIDDIMDTTTLCCNCDFFITQADIDANGGGFFIAKPGNWCLGENIVTNQVIWIRDTPGVTFDLKGRTITSSAVFPNPIILAGNSPDVIVKNGNIIASDPGFVNSGLRAAVFISNSKNSFVENINVTFLSSYDDPAAIQGDSAFQTDGYTIFQNCFATGPYMIGFSTTGTNVQLYNCEVSHFSGDVRTAGTRTAAGVAYFIDGQDHYLENCTSIGDQAQPTSQSAGSTGFYIKAGNTVTYNCTALNHKNTVNTPSSAVPAGFGFYISGDNCQIINSNASNNAQDGIRINANAAIVDNCITVTNRVSGINIASGRRTIVQNTNCSYNTRAGVFVETDAVSIENCTASSNSGSFSGSIGVWLDSGSGANVKGCVCNYNSGPGIFVNVPFHNVTLDNCVTDFNASGIVVSGDNLNGVGINIDNCKARSNSGGGFGTGIIVGIVNPIAAEYTALGVYQIVNSQGIRVTNCVTRGNELRDLIMVIDIRDPLNVQPAILGTWRLISPSVGISSNFRGGLDWDLTAGSSLTGGVIPLLPGAGINLQYSPDNAPPF